MATRDIRRHHTARLKKARQYYWGYGTHRGGLMPPAQAGKVVQYPKPCSCWMCCNPRRHDKDTLTMQEKRHRDMQKIVDE